MIRACNPEKIAHLRDTLAEEAVFHLAGADMALGGLEDLLVLWRRRLPDELDGSVLRDSLADLAHGRFSPAATRLAAWRIAANLTLLRQSRVVPLWTRQVASEWVTVIISDVRSMTRQYGREAPVSGATLTLEIQDGSAAGLSLSRFWTSAALARQRVVFGFARSARQRVHGAQNPGRGCRLQLFQDARQLFGLCLAILLTPEASLEGPGYEKIYTTSHMKEYNRALLARRQRLSYPCPKNYNHACHRCGVGTDQCPMATHARSYVLRDCPACQRQAPYDPGLDEKVCLICQARRVNKEKVA